MTGGQHPAIPPALLTADPGLPRPDPTRSYWQRVPHPLASVQSPSLQQADVAVIGSGITGLSVSRTLLERDLSARVTVLEARTLCSGATGRNGGQLAANAGEEYARLAQAHGPEMAGRIVNFTFQNLHKMHELIQDANEDSEYQQVQKLRVFLTADVFESFKRSIARMEADHSSLRGLYTILDATTILEVCRGLAGKTTNNADNLSTMASQEQPGDVYFPPGLYGRIEWSPKRFQVCCGNTLLD